MPDLTHSERVLRARAAAHSMWAKTSDPSARTAAARRNSPQSLDYWERQVDPDGKLDPADRARRAEHARKAYFTKLSLKSVRSRRRAKELQAEGDAAAAELEQLTSDDPEAA